MRSAIVLLLAACSHSAPPPSEGGALSRAITCSGGDHKVRMAPGASSVTYWKAGALVGTSDCGRTAMAAFNVECRRNPEFQFLFASIPGPPIFQGKSAELKAGDTDVFLECHVGE